MDYCASTFFSRNFAIAVIRRRVQEMAVRLPCERKMPLLVTRQIGVETEMNILLRSVIAAGALTLSIAPAAATLIDFEDVSPGDMPANYQGFTWVGSWVVSAESDDVFSSSGTEAHSQTNYAWTSASSSLSRSDGSPFNFDGFWARIFNPRATAGSAIAFGFTGDAVNGFTEAFQVPLNFTDSYQFYSLNFDGITKWTLASQSANTLIDDITVTPSAVPGPVVGAGLPGLVVAFVLAWMRRRNVAGRELLGH